MMPQRQSLRRKMGKKRNKAANKTPPHPAKSNQQLKNFKRYMRGNS